MEQRLLELEEVLKLTKLSRTTIWRLTKRGKFPQPIRLSARRVAWLKSDVLLWLKNCTNKTDNKQLSFNFEMPTQDSGLSGHGN